MEIPVTLTQAILVFLIIFAGTLLQSSIGFGLGPLAVPLLTLIDPAFIPGPLLLSAMVLTSMMASRDFKSIHFQGVIWAIPGRILGTILATGILLIIPRDSLSILFGAMVLFAILISISGLHPKISMWTVMVAGFFSGLMGTTSAIGGAPMGIVYQDQKGPKIRGTLSSLFVFGTIISLISLILIKRFGLLELKLALIIMPGILSGFYISKYTARILDKGRMRPAILIVSGIAGLAVILKSLLS